VDVKTIYEVPLLMYKEKLDEVVLNKLMLSPKTKPDLTQWISVVDRIKNANCKIKIGLIGKYTQLPDAYKSINESLIHAGAGLNCLPEIVYINSESIEQSNAKEILSDLKGILVAPGFGHRGIEGKITAIQYARENNIPFLGICLGMQCAVIEFARNILGFKHANSTEMHPDTPYPVIDLMEEQKSVINMGGTMRLGSYKCILDKKSNLFKYYNQTEIKERHRHRYEFNNTWLDQFVKAGMVPTGINPESKLVEIIEIPKHKWFVGVQFHPEYKSTVLNPHPIFTAFINACME
jgi:CTP synthase